MYKLAIYIKKNIWSSQYYLLKHNVSTKQQRYLQFCCVCKSLNTTVIRQVVQSGLHEYL